MNNKYLKIETNAIVENIAVIRLCVSTYVSNINVPIDELMDIKTALSEAVTNAVDHAYDNEDENNKIIVETYIEENKKVIIKVKDFGKGIENISLAMTPAYTSKPENEHAGMGFTIMESFMDEIIVDSSINEGTTITLSKNIKIKQTNKV
jgi:stage II sporulation protein AB (anti-sigma F factor)